MLPDQADRLIAAIHRNTDAVLASVEATQTMIAEVVRLADESINLQALLADSQEPEGNAPARDLMGRVVTSD